MNYYYLNLTKLTKRYEYYWKEEEGEVGERERERMKHSKNIVPANARKKKRCSRASKWAKILRFL